MKNLHVLARIRPKPEHLEDARVAIKDIMDATRAEKGCLQFDLFAGQEDGCLYLLEAWEDESALTAHHEKPYTKAVFTQYKEWLERDVELIRMHADN